MGTGFVDITRQFFNSSTNDLLTLYIAPRQLSLVNPMLQYIYGAQGNADNDSLYWLNATIQVSLTGPTIGIRSSSASR
jgi:hypothetical protein